MSGYPSAVRVDFVFGRQPGHVFYFFTPTGFPKRIFKNFLSRRSIG